jgi:hypothetical protein
MSTVVALRTAQSLGQLGLLPFFALAVLAWLPADASIGQLGIARLALLSLVAYAAVILSFLGAVHWGFALHSPSLSPPALRRALGWGVVPALLGWLALLLLFVGLAPAWVLAILVGDLLLVRLMDGALLREYPAAPAGYLQLRTRLTAGASLALVIALAASL